MSSGSAGHCQAPCRTWQLAVTYKLRCFGSRLLAIHDQCHRTIVDQLDLHHGPKPSGRGWNAVGTNGIDKRFVKRNRVLGRGGVNKAWPAALAAIAVERELTHDQDHAAD